MKSVCMNVAMVVAGFAMASMAFAQSDPGRPDEERRVEKRVHQRVERHEVDRKERPDRPEGERREVRGRTETQGEGVRHGGRRGPGRGERGGERERSREGRPDRGWEPAGRSQGAHEGDRQGRGRGGREALGFGMRERGPEGARLDEAGEHRGRGRNFEGRREGGRERGMDRARRSKGSRAKGVHERRGSRRRVAEAASRRGGPPQFHRARRGEGAGMRQRGDRGGHRGSRVRGRRGPWHRGTAPQLRSGRGAGEFWGALLWRRMANRFAGENGARFGQGRGPFFSCGQGSRGGPRWQGIRGQGSGRSGQVHGRGFRGFRKGKGESSRPGKGRARGWDRRGS